MSLIVCLASVLINASFTLPAVEVMFRGIGGDMTFVMTGGPTTEGSIGGLRLVSEGTVVNNGVFSVVSNTDETVGWC